MASTVQAANIFDESAEGGGVSRLPRTTTAKKASRKPREKSAGSALSSRKLFGDLDTNSRSARGGDLNLENNKGSAKGGRALVFEDAPPKAKPSEAPATKKAASKVRFDDAARPRPREPPTASQTHLKGGWRDDDEEVELPAGRTYREQQEYFAKHKDKLPTYAGPDGEARDPNAFVDEVLEYEPPPDLGWDDTLVAKHQAKYGDDVPEIYRVKRADDDLGPPIYEPYLFDLDDDHFGFGGDKASKPAKQKTVVPSGSAS